MNLVGMYWVALRPGTVSYLRSLHGYELSPGLGTTLVPYTQAATPYQAKLPYHARYHQVINLRCNVRVPTLTPRSQARLSAREHLAFPGMYTLRMSYTRELQCRA